MKKHIIKLTALVLILIFSSAVYSQESKDVPAKKSPAAVKHTFENAVLINNQTVERPAKKTLDFIIQHRFGLIETPNDLFGLYAPSNIRLGLDYGITDRLSVGIGATKNKRYYDVQWKYILMQQMSGGGFPVTIAYFGDLARSADDKDKFYNQDSTYNQANRIAYFHEIMFARKVNSHLSLQLAGTYTYFNIVDSIKDEHNIIGASFTGKYRFSPQSSVLVEFDYPLNVSGINKDYRPQPNLGIGFEVATSGHQFQIFICTANGIINQETRSNNLNDLSKVFSIFEDKNNGFVLGFNITRQWGF